MHGYIGKGSLFTSRTPVFNREAKSDSAFMDGFLLPFHTSQAGDHSQTNRNAGNHQSRPALDGAAGQIALLKAEHEILRLTTKIRNLRKSCSTSGHSNDS